ncbi:MAG TPA: enolase C-terminal domain-like protein [Streptosporangiaceae bacterium]|nr:enolase C-terminal domain-like protein [Streptosporangiaceae bacterium]
MAPIIDGIRVVANDASRGDDAWFIGVEGARKTGWYGPVTTEIGRYVEEVLVRVVTGESIMDHHRLHAALCCATDTDARPVASWAVGAVDCAAWDLHGQLVQASVAHLLAACPQPEVPLYASWLGLDLSLSTPAATVAQVRRGGWQFTKWGLRKCPNADPRAEATRLAATTQTVAAALGEAAAFDAVFTWDHPLADLVADKLDPANVLWLEDPLPDYDLEPYRSLASKTPLALGERLLVHADGHALLGLKPRAFTLDVVGCGGLTRAVDLVIAAYALGISVYPHGRSFIPAVHLAAAYPDAIPAVEYRLQWEPVRQRGYARPWLPAHAAITIPGSPGLGATPRSC